MSPFRLTLWTLLSLILPGMAAPAENPMDEHQTLRNETAIRYMTPDAHVKLARYHYDQGNKIQAFYLAEAAREMFGDDAFTPVFTNLAAVKMDEPMWFEDEKDEAAYCLQHPQSPEAQWLSIRTNLDRTAAHDLPLLDQARVAYPSLPELELWRFDVLLTAGQTNAAEDALTAALAKFPNDVRLKGMAAKYYLKQKQDLPLAMSLYIDLYFYDPHYYDWEYAEFRIKDISAQMKKGWWEERLKSGQPLLQLVRAERNPRVLDVPLNEADEKWDREWVLALLAMFDHDDPNIQRRALHLLLAHPEDVNDPALIDGLLQSDDLVKRAMAAFLVVKILGPKQYGRLQENLDSGIALLQLDAIQALATMGGPEGRAYLKDHPPAGASEEIAQVYKQALASPP